MVIAAAFMLTIPLGIVATGAVIFHEIPQELSDFGILLFGGFSKRKALMFNFASAATAIAGALVVYFYLGALQLEAPLIAFAAGGFIYVASVGLIPRLHQELSQRRSVIQLFLFLAGIAMIQGLSMVAG